MTEDQIAIFEEHNIRRVYDQKTETWYFSVVDIVRALTDQPDYQHAGNYWRVLKSRLKKEGSEVITKCNKLRLTDEDNKKDLQMWLIRKPFFAWCSRCPRPRPNP